MKQYFTKTEIALWSVSAAVCFAAFLLNDIYGFISWKRLYKRQKNNA